MVNSYSYDGNHGWRDSSKIQIGIIILDILLNGAHLPEVASTPPEYMANIPTPHLSFVIIACLIVQAIKCLGMFLSAQQSRAIKLLK